MRYKITLTYLDGTTKTFYVVQGSFRPLFGYIYKATGEDGQEIYVNRQAVRTVVYTSVEA